MNCLLMIGICLILTAVVGCKQSAPGNEPMITGEAKWFCQHFSL